MSALVFSPHAKMRRKQMKLTERQIEAVVAEPQCTYTDDLHGRPRKVSVRDHLAVVTDLDGTEVVTVLWHGCAGRDENGGPK